MSCAAEARAGARRLGQHHARDGPRSQAHGLLSAPPALLTGEAHVWRASIEELAEHRTALDALLDDEERERGSRFHLAADRMRHTVSHGVLRLALGHHVRVAPAELRFRTGSHGKPHLADDALAFNMSHSGDVVLVAIAREGRIGIDIERWTDRLDDEELARLAHSVFSQREREALSELPAMERRAAFFATWTRKEAYVKALGTGVAHGLHHFDVTCSPGDARLLEDRVVAPALGRIALHDIDAGEGYSAALAAERHVAKVMTFTLNAPTVAALLGQPG